MPSIMVSPRRRTPLYPPFGDRPKRLEFDSWRLDSRGRWLVRASKRGFRSFGEFLAPKSRHPSVKLANTRLGRSPEIDCGKTPEILALFRVTPKRRDPRPTR